MSETPREARVLDAVVTLVDTLLTDFDVVELLTSLTERCAALLDVTSAGLLLADPVGQPHLMAATSSRTEQVELLQLQTNEGPCLDCYATGEPVSVADLSAVARRWPQFAAAAAAADIASVHAVPMRAAGSVLGALGLFGARTGELNEADLLVGRSLAHVASVAIVQGRAPTRDDVLPHLRSALANQVVVEQAKGLLRQRLGITVADAFTLMRRYARNSGMQLSEVARQLMSDPQTRPDLIAALAQLTTGRDAPADAD